MLSMPMYRLLLILLIFSCTKSEERNELNAINEQQNTVFCQNPIGKTLDVLMYEFNLDTADYYISHTGTYDFAEDSFYNVQSGLTDTLFHPFVYKEVLCHKWVISDCSMWVFYPVNGTLGFLRAKSRCSIILILYIPEIDAVNYSAFRITCK